MKISELFKKRFNRKFYRDFCLYLLRAADMKEKILFPLSLETHFILSLLAQTELINQTGRHLFQLKQNLSPLIFVEKENQTDGPFLNP